MNRSLYRTLAILAAAGGLVGLFLTRGNTTMEQGSEFLEQTRQTQAGGVTEQLEFPYTLPESGLVVEGLLSYSGTYMEDGSGEQVTEITGLMVYNPGDRMVRFGALALEREGNQLYFFVYCLPPGERCLILEKSRQPYQQLPVTECRELSVRWEYQQLHTQQLCYIGFGERLTLVNHSARQQRHVTVWYKQYDHEGAYYLGGIAYSAHIFRLQAQEQRVLTPEHYHAGNAKVVAIELEET